MLVSDAVLDSALGEGSMIGDVTLKGSPEPLLTIGEFARLTRLTTKALRIYDESGLLRPKQVDRANGYRRYSIEQSHTARLIGLLRATNLGLPEIGLLLAELDTEPAQAVDRLDRHLRHLEAQHTSLRTLIWSDPRNPDGLGVGSCHGGGLVVDGAEVAEGGVAAGRVVEGFDPVEHRLGEPGAGGPVVPVEQFALQ